MVKAFISFMIGCLVGYSFRPFIEDEILPFITDTIDNIFEFFRR